jgi:dTDP-4-dehydrorhamnose reductase
MRVLILGAAGMLGHQLCLQFRERYETWATVRKLNPDDGVRELLPRERLIEGVDAFQLQSVIAAIAQVKPDVIINCIGIIKQLQSAKNPVISLTVNALFPHHLHQLAQISGARLIHFSTDCVFSGKRGMYTEADISDAEDLYGRTKYLGEVAGEGALTIRSSIIGRELSTQSGLVEWFLSNEGGKVRGFRKAIYSGFTTAVMAEIISNLLEHHPQLSGVYQISSEPINKYELLLLVRDAFGANITIEPDDDFVIDRSLDSSRFRAETGFTPPSWEKMIADLARQSHR